MTGREYRLFGSIVQNMYISLRLLPNRQQVLLSVTFRSFVDDLGFKASSSSVKKLVKILDKVAQTVLEWGVLNAVTYDTAKTEAVLFSQLHRQRLNKLREAN